VCVCVCVCVCVVCAEQVAAPPRGAKPDTGVGSGSGGTASAPAPSGVEKPAHDVVAGAMARAASQSTIHPLDTMKVRMQACGAKGERRQ
jgi:hypothetical protein